MEEKDGVVAIDLTRKLALVLAGLAIAVPFVTSNQLVTGTLVNAGLFLGAYYLSPKYFWPVVVFPSLAVMARGIIFGPLTPFVYYFIPFIWVGNWVLVKSASKGDAFRGYFWGIVGKVGILYIGANVFVIFKIAPKMFLTAMGVMQLITAILGGVIAWTIIKKLKS